MKNVFTIDGSNNANNSYPVSVPSEDVKEDQYFQNNVNLQNIDMNEVSVSQQVMLVDRDEFSSILNGCVANITVSVSNVLAANAVKIDNLTDEVKKLTDKINQLLSVNSNYTDASNIIGDFEFPLVDTENVIKLDLELSTLNTDTFQALVNYNMFFLITFNIFNIFLSIIVF